MKKWADLLATVGEFTDENGRKAKRSLKVGAIMRDPETGRMSLKVDAVPTSPSWSGWLAVRNIQEDGAPDSADDAEGEPSAD